MSISLFSLAILILFATIAAIEIYRGIKRGFFKTLISLGVAVVSVLLSLLISPMIAQFISERLSINASMGSEMYEEISKSINIMLSAFVTIIISTVLFAVMFFVLRGIVALITFSCIKKGLRRKNHSENESDTFIERNNRLLGAVTGTATAIIVTMVILSPVMGTLDVANRTLEIFHRNKLDISVSEEIYNEVNVYSKDLPGNVFYQLGGKFMYNASATAKIYDERIYLISEIDAFGDTVDDFVYVSKILQDPDEVNKSHVKRIDELCSDIERIKLFKGVIGSGLSGASKAWLNNESYLTIKRPVLNNIIDPAFDEVLEACAKTKTHSATANTVTLLRVYGAILESDILSLDEKNYDTVMQHIKEKDIIDEMNSIIKENPYMKDVSVSAIALSVVSDRLKNFNYNETKYNALMDNIADAINTVNNKGYGSDSEKIDALSKYAEKYIGEYGYEIPEDIAEAASEEILKAFTDTKETITSDDVRALFDKYAE